VHTLYVFASLELRRAHFDEESGEYEDTLATEVAYLTAQGTRIGRLAFEPPDTAVPTTDGRGLHVFLELADHLGSKNLIVDKATSELVEESTFQAYGVVDTDLRSGRWANFREDYRFTGKEEDVEVGLQYFGKRFFNPNMGRWMSSDPLSVHAVGKSDLNVYAYVRGMALKAIDPVGLLEFSSYDAYKCYQTGKGDVKAREDIGSQGHWLAEDRLLDSKVWDAANRFNIEKDKGYEQYVSIEQRASFYGWFDRVTKAMGHETRWLAAANQVASNVATLHRSAPALWGSATSITRGVDTEGNGVFAEIYQFTADGNKAIFNDVYGKLQALYHSDHQLKGAEAAAWDAKQVAEEQQLVQAGYDKLSPAARSEMNAMVTQKSPVAMIGKALGFTKLAPLHGNLMVFEDRWVYGMQAMDRDPNATARPDTAIAYKTGDRYREVISWGPRTWGP
jgi:RHS repeat-associated protein